jgi:hypothetical protein
MRVVIAGLDANGLMRKKAAVRKCVATVDNVDPNASYSSIQDVDINSYDAVIILGANEQKYNLCRYALANKKHVLVENPWSFVGTEQLEQLLNLAKNNNRICYTSYSHRFDPQVMAFKELLTSRQIDDIFHCRLFYAKNLPDVSLNMTILSLLHYWFGNNILTSNFRILKKRSYIGKQPEHIIFADMQAEISIEVEVSLLSKTNYFSCELITAQGNSRFTFEPTQTITEQAYGLEYEYFKSLCAEPLANPQFRVEHWIQTEAIRLLREELLLA